MSRASCPLLWFFPHISVWGSSFVGCHPARLRPSLRPSLLRPSLLRPSLTHAIILSSDLFPSHTIISSSHTRSSCHLTSHIHTHNHLIISHTHSSCHHLTSFSHFSHCLSFSFSFILFHLHLIYSPFFGVSQSHTHNHLVALIHSQLHLFALLVTSHTRSGRRSLQRLQKGLRRALSPLGARLAPQWPAQSPETAEGAAARVVAAGGPALSAVAGAVSRDCRRGCGARCRRWGPGSLRNGRRSLQRLQKGRSGRRSLQRLQKGLRRALSPLGARLSPQWPAQSPETAEGAAARVVAAGGPALSAVASVVPRDCRRGCGARCRRWGPLRIAL